MKFPSSPGLERVNRLAIDMPRPLLAASEYCINC